MWYHINATLSMPIQSDVSNVSGALKWEKPSKDCDTAVYAVRKQLACLDMVATQTPTCWYIPISYIWHDGIDGYSAE